MFVSHRNVLPDSPRNGRRRPSLSSLACCSTLTIGTAASLMFLSLQPPLDMRSLALAAQGKWAAKQSR